MLPSSRRRFLRQGFHAAAAVTAWRGLQIFSRAATPIPVVMEKCIMCHENYREVEKGKAIGAISYKVPVQE